MANVKGLRRALPGAAALALALAAAAAAAIWPFSEAIRPDPLRKAENFFKQKAFPETIDVAGHALDGSLTKRETARAYWLMGQSYEGMGRLDKALSVYQLAVRILPKDAGLLLSIGGLYERVGLEDRAQTEFQAVLDLYPTNMAAQFGLGDLLLAQGLYEDSLAHFRKVLAAHAEDPKAALGAARSLQGLGRFDEAEALLRGVLGPALAEDEGALWAALAEVQKGRGDLESAIASLDRALALAPARDDLALRRVGWLLEADRLSEAADGARAALAKRPEEPLARFFLGLAQLRGGDAAAARASLSEASDAAADQGVDPFLRKSAARLLAELPPGAPQGTP